MKIANRSSLLASLVWRKSCNHVSPIFSTSHITDMNHRGSLFRDVLEDMKHISYLSRNYRWEEVACYFDLRTSYKDHWSLKATTMSKKIVNF